MRAQFTGLSERRACGLIGTPRSSHRYKKQEQPLNEELQSELRELAMENPRYGYRRLHVLLGNARRKKAEFNVKRIHRLYKSAGLSIRRIERKRVRRAAVPWSS